VPGRANLPESSGQMLPTVLPGGAD